MVLAAHAATANMDESARRAAVLAAFAQRGLRRARRPSPAESAGPTDQQRADKEMELRGVEDTLRQSEEQRRAIEAEIDSVRADRARLSAALIETTAKVQDAERGAAAAADRLSSLNATADELSRSLERRRGVIADVLAALQRMGSNPPPAILVKPDDMSEAVRAATVMGSLIPELKSEIEAARRDLDDLAKTRESIARERDELTEKGKALAADKMRLAALIDARQQSLASAQDALGSQQQRAAELAKKATSLKDLIIAARQRKRPRAKLRRPRRMRPRSRRRPKSKPARRLRAAPIRRALSPKSPSPTRKDTCRCPPPARF